MKKLLFASAMAGLLMLSSCGKGKPDLDNPDAVAKFYCEKMSEMIKLLSDPVDNKENSEKIDAIGKEMDEFEKEFNAHHGDKAPEMSKKIGEIQKTMCPETATAF